jgi:DNA primase
MIPEPLLDDIQTRADLVELISRFVPLKRAGRHFKALCPFHHEKTPSFVVNPDKQIFHCFGCGVGGDVFSFLMQHDRLTFPEAVRQLAEQVGVRMPEQGGSDGASRARMIEVLDKVCRYFERTLRDPTLGHEARAYLARRGISERSWEVFRLGAAPAGWRHLTEAAAARGVTNEQLEEAGVAIRAASGAHDRFRHRVIFPIMNGRAQVVGFGGRSLDAQEPKYLNSPETPLYHKGQQVFGLAQAKDAIIAAKTAVVVEGYFDCVALAQAGLSCVVSPLGTALTQEHVRLLRRYAERVILAFDADAAGEQATVRGIELLLEEGLSVQVARLPDGVDPDEYLARHGAERLRRLLMEESVPLIDALLEQALKRFPSDAAEARVGAAQWVLNVLVKVPDAMLRHEYAQTLAHRLRLDEAALMSELGKLQSRGARAAGAKASGSAEDTSAVSRSVTSPVQGAERVLTALIVDDPSRWTQAQHALSLDDVTHPTLRLVLRAVCELQASGRSATPGQVISRLRDEGLAAVVSELVELAATMALKDEAFAESLARLSHEAAQRELARLRRQLAAAHEAGQEEDVQRLLREYQQSCDTVGTGRR